MGDLSKSTKKKNGINPKWTDVINFEVNKYIISFMITCSNKDEIGIGDFEIERVLDG